MDAVHPGYAIGPSFTSPPVSEKLADQHYRVCIALASHASGGKLLRGCEEGRNGGDAVGTEESELKGCFVEEGELELG